jgi:hypothetical protein
VGTDGARPALRKCSICACSNRSMPAGTGVWVVNTVAERTAVRASSHVIGSVPSAGSMSSAIRSTPRNPAWPSLQWKTSGAGAPVSREKARSARIPPIPRSSSCWSRWSPPPP